MRVWLLSFNLFVLSNIMSLRLILSNIIVWYLISITIPIEVYIQSSNKQKQKRSLMSLLIASRVAKATNEEHLTVTISWIEPLASDHPDQLAQAICSRIITVNFNCIFINIFPSISSIIHLRWWDEENIKPRSLTEYTLNTHAYALPCRSSWVSY